MPEIEELEAAKTEIARLKAILKEIADGDPEQSCGNGCYVARPRGMATNGGCRHYSRRPTPDDVRKLIFIIQDMRGKARGALNC